MKTYITERLHVENNYLFDYHTLDNRYYCMNMAHYNETFQFSGRLHEQLKVLLILSTMKTDVFEKARIILKKLYSTVNTCVSACFGIHQQVKN
jgi:hypothetical protein